MLQYFKTNEAAANDGRAMESKTISKNGASPKSQMSRGNLLKILCFALFATVLIFSGCNKDKNGDKDDGYLVTEISGEYDGWFRSTIYEYDDQNRITKISYSEDGYGSTVTITYNSANLVTLKNIYGDVMMFTKTGNIITGELSWGDNSGFKSTMELNAQGLVEKWAYEEYHDDGYWYKYVIIFKYQGKNIIKLTNEWEEDWYGEHHSETTTVIFTYDNKKSPFYNSNTPQWLMPMTLDEPGIYNNITSVVWDDGDQMTTMEYTYNTDGFPLSRIVTESRMDDERVREYTEIFKYGNLVGQKRAPSRSNVGSASPRIDVRKNNWLLPKHK